MKLLIGLSCLSQIQAQLGGAYWISTKSGQYAECMTDFYLDGVCESRADQNCKFDGLIGKQGIQEYNLWVITYDSSNWLISYMINQ